MPVFLALALIAMHFSMTAAQLELFTPDALTELDDRVVEMGVLPLLLPYEIAVGDAGFMLQGTAWQQEAALELASARRAILRSLDIFREHGKGSLLKVTGTLSAHKILNTFQYLSSLMVVVYRWNSPVLCVCVCDCVCMCVCL